MATVLARTKEMTRDDWLAARRVGIGSSDAAAVLGLDEYRSPLDVYLSKRGLLPEEPGNRFTEWGTRLEPLVADWFTAETGKKVRNRNAILAHVERPYIVANLDRTVVGEPAVLEIKTTSAWKRDEWEDGAIPLRVVVQVQHQLMVTGDAYGYVAVLIGGNDPRWQRLDRDEALIEQMLARYEAFWFGHVEAGVEPPPSAASDAETMDRLYPQEEAGKSVLLPLGARATLEALARAKADRMEAEAREKAARAAVEALLGDAEIGMLPGIAGPVVTWKTQERKAHSVAASSFRKLNLRERVLSGK